MARRDLPDLYVLRHGQTEWNAIRRMQGRANSALTPQGRREAAGQGEILRELGVAALPVLCSPLGRAVETAVIALGPDLVRVDTDPRLMEIDVGDWTGLRRGEGGLPALDPASPPDLTFYDRAPGGEGLDRLQARCARLLAEITQPTILVTHGITSRMLRSVAIHGDARALEALPGGQGVVHAVRGGAHQTFG